MAINAQLFHSIDRDLLCAYSINILLKRLVLGILHYVSQMTINSLRKISGVVYLSWIHIMMLPDFICILWFDILCFSSSSSFFFGGDYWIWVWVWRENLSFSQFALVFSPILEGTWEVEWYIYQFLYIILLWEMGHGPLCHSHAHASNWTGYEWRAPTTCGHECSSVQGVLELLHFVLIFC